jgi:hypothetical protein
MDNDTDIPEKDYTNANTAQGHYKAKKLAKLVRNRFGTRIQLSSVNGIDVNIQVLEGDLDLHAFNVRVDLQGHGAQAQSLSVGVNVNTSELRLQELFLELEHKITDRVVHMAYCIGQASIAQQLKAIVELGG